MPSIGEHRSKLSHGAEEKKFWLPMNADRTRILLSFIGG